MVGDVSRTQISPILFLKTQLLSLLPFNSQMNFKLDIEDFTIILNALHYYKKVEKRGNFQQYDDERINALRDTLAHQLTNQPE